MTNIERGEEEEEDDDDDDLFSHADMTSLNFFRSISDTQTNDDQTVKKNKMPREIKRTCSIRISSTLINNKMHERTTKREKKEPRLH